MPGYRQLWIGQLISQFGDVLHFMVFMWWAGELGGPKAVGVVAACSVSTALLMSMIAGTTADRVDRRKILLISDLVCGFVVLGLAAVAFMDRTPPLWVLCVFVIALKTAFVFQAPARTASVPRLVPMERLLEANSVNSSIQTAMPLAGNAVGAMVLGLVYQISRPLTYVLAFAINACSFFTSALFMARLPKIKPERTEVPKHPLHDAVEGVRYILGHPVLRMAVFVYFGFDLFVAPFMQAYVAVAQTTLKEGTWLFGVHLQGPALLSLLEAAFFAGYAIGSYRLYAKPVRRVGLAFSFSIAVGSALIIPMGFVKSAALFSLLNFVSGLFFPFGLITLDTYIQADTPDAFRGRVSSAIATLAGIALPAGMLGAGYLIEAIGTGGIYVVMGSGLAAFAVLGSVSPAFRNAEIPEPVTLPT